MIFVTVGTQLAFDRLIAAVDEWAGQQKTVDVFAQIGPARIAPVNLRFAPMLSPDDTTDCFRKAEVVVAHAGMGSILTALKFRKPIIVMPRRAEFGEHRNDHQVATAKWLGGRRGIYVAESAEQLFPLLDARGRLGAGDEISDSADLEFIDRLKTEILGN